MLANETQHMLHVRRILFFFDNLDISGLAAELRCFRRAAAVANRAPIVQKGAGHKRQHPVRSSTQGCLGGRGLRWDNGWKRAPGY